MAIKLYMCVDLFCYEMGEQVPLYKQPASVILGTAGIVQHAILNDRRHVLTKVSQLALFLLIPVIWCIQVCCVGLTWIGLTCRWLPYGTVGCSRHCKTLGDYSGGSYWRLWEGETFFLPARFLVLPILVLRALTVHTFWYTPHTTYGLTATCHCCNGGDGLILVSKSRRVISLPLAASDFQP